MQVNVNSINAHMDWLANNANNIANVNTDGYKAIDTTLDAGSHDNDGDNSIKVNSTRSKHGTNLVKDFAGQISISEGVKANVSAINTQNKALGSLLDILV